MNSYVWKMKTRKISLSYCCVHSSLAPAWRRIVYFNHFALNFVFQVISNNVLVFYFTLSLRLIPCNSRLSIISITLSFRFKKNINRKKNINAINFFKISRRRRIKQILVDCQKKQ